MLIPVKPRRRGQHGQQASCRQHEADADQHAMRQSSSSERVHERPSLTESVKNVEQVKLKEPLVLIRS